MRIFYHLLFSVLMSVPAVYGDNEKQCISDEQVVSECRVLGGLETLCSFKATEIYDGKWKAMLLGSHKLSLQWIGSEKPGTVTITEDKGLLYISGRQEDGATGDFLKITGKIKSAGKREFTFCGVILTKVSYINGGAVCRRSGSYVFAVRGERRYWRMQDKANPCEATEQGPILDYVDIYIR